MADNDVQIKVGGDVKDLQKAANQATKELAKIGDAQKDVSKSSGRLSDRAKDASNALSKSSNSTRQAQFALTNLNRVVQDAPFGFIAIQNNIDPLIQSFLSLRATTGSAGGALKALLSSFSGPAGILTLVSIATSAIVVFGDKIAGAFGKAEDSAKKAREALKDATDQLLKIDKTGGAKFSFDTREELIGAIQRATAELSIFQDQAEAASTELATLSEKARSGQTKGIEQAQQLVTITEQNVQKQQDRVDKLKDELREWDAITDQAGYLNRLGAINTGELEKQKKLAEDQAKALKEAAEAFVFNQGPARQFPEPLFGGRSKPEIPLPRDINVLGKAGAGGKEDPFDTLQLGILTTQKALKEGILTDMEALQRETGLLKQQALLLLSEGVSPLSEQFAYLRDRIHENEDKMKAMNQQVTLGGDIFSDLGAQAAATFAQIALGFEKTQSLGEAFKSLLGGLVAELAAAAAKAALLTVFFPGASKAAGGFGGLFRGLIGLASGGIVTRPTPALIGESGPEAVIPLSKLGSIGSQRLEIVALRMAGGDLLFSLQDAQGTRGVGGVNLT